MEYIKNLYFIGALFSRVTEYSGDEAELTRESVPELEAVFEAASKNGFELKLVITGNGYPCLGGRIYPPAGEKVKDLNYRTCTDSWYTFYTDSGPWGGPEICIGRCSGPFNEGGRQLRGDDEVAEYVDTFCKKKAHEREVLGYYS